MYSIIWLQDNCWQIFTNEIWETEKEALDYAKRNKFNKKIKWKVVLYNREYFIY